MFGEELATGRHHVALPGADTLLYYADPLGRSSTIRSIIQAICRAREGATMIEPAAKMIGGPENLPAFLNSGWVILFSLDAAGFALDKVTSTDSMMKVIEAVPA